MSERESRESPAGRDSSFSPKSAVEDEAPVGPVQGLIKSAVLGFAFGTVLFMVSDQTGFAESLLHWLDVPGGGNHLGPKQLVIFGILLGVSLNVLNNLFRRVRNLLGNLVA